MSENNNSNNENNNIENIDENTENIENSEIIEEPVEDSVLDVLPDDIIVPETETETETETKTETETETDAPDTITINKRGSFKDSIFGTALILALVTVVTVFTISLFNVITKETIEARLLKEKAEAIEKLFGAGIEFTALEGFEEIYMDFDAPVLGVYLITDEQRLGDNKTAGYCVMVAPKGFTDSIIMLVAVNPNVTVKDTTILSMSETVGYGTRLEGEVWFREQFKNKTISIKEVRSDPPPDENVVQIMAQATVSSKAFIRGVNAALDVINEISDQIRFREPDRVNIPGEEIEEQQEPEIPEEPEENENAEEDDDENGENGENGEEEENPENG